jgi:hypothetical protein
MSKVDFINCYFFFLEIMMRIYNHPVRTERTDHSLPIDNWLTSRHIPRETWRTEICPRPSIARYDLPTQGVPYGFWEPVQPSAQRVPRVNLSSEENSSSASRLHREFSGLHCDDDLEVDGDLYTGKHSRKFDYNKNYSDQDLERPEERPYHSTSRTSNGYFSKPVRRVIHDPSDRLIPIQVEHSRSIPIPQPVNRYKESRVPVHSRMNTNVRTNSRNYIDLSDYEDSSSDQSDCDIYPFICRKKLINDVRTRRGSDLYSIDLRSNSPSPDTDCRLVSPPYTPSRVITRRTQCHSPDRDVMCLSDINGGYKKQKDRKSPFSVEFEGDSYGKYKSDISDKLDKLPSSSAFYKSKGNHKITRDDEDSAFSVNIAYQSSDEDDGVIGNHSDEKYDYDIVIKDTSGHRRVSDSDKRANGHRRGSDSDEGASGHRQVNRRVSDSDEGISPTPNYPAYNLIRKVILPEKRQVDYIRGDGNCFFRALSKVIYNTESCHEEIRQAVVDVMEKYPKDFEQFIDGKSLEYHMKSMRRSGTWGTQAEIYGAATLLQRDIYILSPDHSGKQYRWLLFSPRFKQTHVNSFDLCYITLCHTNGNHYDRIAPLIGQCNCALLPPQLSGVKEHVDLTESEELMVV